MALFQLMGMENYYISMYDAPETLHKVMDMATKIYEDFYGIKHAPFCLSSYQSVNQKTPKST